MGEWTHPQRGHATAYSGIGADARQAVSEYDEFRGTLHVVDLADTDRTTEDFDGREWLERRTREGLPVGWDIEWVPDRNRDASNPIALMQFADEETALLIRTHRTRNWLPGAVIRCLMSERCKKVGVGYDGNDRQKMQITFDLQPSGIVDMALIAKDQKGIALTGLKALSEYFGFRMKKESRVARSNWAAPSLSRDQIQYAAEDAYFTYAIFKKLEELPDVEVDLTAPVDLLELKEGWAEQGIEKRHDGLWCKYCDKGPMNMPGVVLSHMSGKQHAANVKRKRVIEEAPTHLPEYYIQNGIIMADETNDLKKGEYKCRICNAGPFISLAVADAHIGSKKHQQKTAPPKPVVKPVIVEKVIPKDPFEDGLWNLPDYVNVTMDPPLLFCTLCEAKANSLKGIYNHLNGDKHAKKCRSNNIGEVIFVKESQGGQRGRLELLSNGQAVVRNGFILPRRLMPGDGSVDAESEYCQRCEETQPSDEEEETAEAEETCGDTEVTADVKPVSQAKMTTVPRIVERRLPSGWETYIDPGSNRVYYWNTIKEEAQWDFPEATGVTQINSVAGTSSATCDAASRADDVARSAEGSTTIPTAVICHSSERLPPGWQEVRCASSEQNYFVDVQTQASQWHKPDNVKGASQCWQRLFDDENRAYWECPELGDAFSFYELVENGSCNAAWLRFRDCSGGIYWSNESLSARFWEIEPVHTAY